MRTVYLIRHGKTAANEAHLYCGSTDQSLSPAGRAELLALREAGGYPDAAGLRCFTSGMRRTEETLDLLYGPVERQAVPGLREMDFGVFEGHSYDELCRRADYQTWLTGDNEKNRCPNGESGKEMTKRVLAAFGALPEAGDLLIVSHGGPIAALMAHLFPDAGKNRYEWQPKNGHGWAVTLDGFRPLAYRPVPSK